MKSTPCPQTNRACYARSLLFIAALVAPAVQAEPPGLLSRLGRSIFNVTERLERGGENENKPKSTAADTRTPLVLDQYGRPIPSRNFRAKKPSSAPPPVAYPAGQTRYLNETQPYVQLQPGSYLNPPSIKTTEQDRPYTSGTAPASTTGSFSSGGKPKPRAHERIAFDPLLANPLPNSTSNDPAQPSAQPTVTSAPTTQITSSGSITTVPAPAAPPQATVKPAATPEDVPFATFLRPGHVRMPFAPHSTLNVEGMASGSLARDPTSGRKFRVP